MDDPIKAAGINDEPEIPDPNEFEDGDANEEFDYLDGVEVPDPITAEEVQD